MTGKARMFNLEAHPASVLNAWVLQIPESRGMRLCLGQARYRFRRKWTTYQSNGSYRDPNRRGVASCHGHHTSPVSIPRTEISSSCTLSVLVFSLTTSPFSTGKTLDDRNKRSEEFSLVQRGLNALA